MYNMPRLRGVKKYGYEFFGSPTGTRAWYHNMRFYSGNMKKFHKDIYMIGEIGHGGHGSSRLSSDIAYAYYYDATCAAKPSDYNNQYVEQHAWDGQPSLDRNLQGRYAHWAGGAMGYLRSFAECAMLPQPKSLVVIASRGIVEFQSGMSAGFYQANNPALFLDQLHYNFDMGGQEALSDGFIDSVDTVFYAPSQSSPLHLRAIDRWLKSKSGRTLITHSSVPCNIFDGALKLAKGIPQLSWEAGKPYLRFAGEDISIGSATLIKTDSSFAKRQLKLDGINVERYYGIISEGRVVLADDHGTPLISEIPRSKSRILYLHCALPFNDNDEFNRKVIDKLMMLAGEKPEVIGSAAWSIHRYCFDEGQSMIGWHIPTVERQDTKSYWDRIPVEPETLQLTWTGPTEAHPL